MFARSMIARFLPLAAVAACLALAAPASAATRWSYLGEARTPQIETDPRYAAWEDPAGVTHLFDTRTGRRSKHKRPLADCPFTNIGGGRILWDCRVFPIRVAYKNTGTSKVTKRTLESDAVAGGTMDIGAYWIKGWENRADGTRGDAWWRVTDGKRGAAPKGPRRIDDLNRSGLSVELCSPLRRRENIFFGQNGDTTRYARYQYDGRFGLTADGFKWILERCGGRSREVTLGLEGGELSAGRISWAYQGRVWVHNAATGRRTSWRIKDIHAESDNANVRTTADRVFVTVWQAAGGFSAARVYTARL